MNLSSGNSKYILIGTLSSFLIVEFIIYCKQHNFLYNVKKTNEIKKKKVYDEIENNPHPSRCKEKIIEQVNNTFNDNLKNLTVFYYPYCLRSLGSLANICVKSYWRYKYGFHVTYEKYENVNFYVIYPNSKGKSTNKHLVLFNGFGGFIIILSRLVNFFVSKGITVHIPVYGPSDGTLHYKFYFEQLYYENIVVYLMKKDIYSIHIACWSLGGVLYKGFEEYINKYHNFRIETVFLFEPLVCLNGVLDCQIGNYRESLRRLCRVTKAKYFLYNIIFCNFMYSTVGLAVRQSFNYYDSIEFTDKEKKIYPYRRVLFLSDNDMIINQVRDHVFISKNFHKSNIFHRLGYHGGWVKSRNLYLLDI